MLLLIGVDWCLIYSDGVHYKPVYSGCTNKKLSVMSFAHGKPNESIYGYTSKISLLKDIQLCYTPQCMK